MWTLTVPGRGTSTYAEAVRLFTEWMKGPSGRRKRPGASALIFHGAYMAFPERHPGGHGWHWHVLTNRYVRAEVVRASWTGHLRGWGRSFGTFTHARVHGKSFGSSRSAASYASKYVGKAIDQVGELGRHRYRVGEGVEAPAPVYELLLARDVWDAAYQVIPTELEPRMVRVQGAGPPAVWAGW